MRFWESVLISLICALVLPVVFSTFWFFKVRDEKKLNMTGETIRTRPPKILSGFFLGFASIVLLGGISAIILFLVYYSEDILAIIILSAFTAVFSGLSFLGYLSVRFNYVILDDKGLIVFRLFQKKKYYLFEDISYVEGGNYNSYIDSIGAIVGYDENNKILFTINGLHIGASAVANRLREHGVKEKRNVQNKCN